MSVADESSEPPVANRGEPAPERRDRARDRDAGASRAVTLGCIGDVHGRMDRLEQVTGWLAGRELAGLLVTGDFAGGGLGPGPRPLEATLARLEPLGVPVLFVPGNHDTPELPHPGNVDRRVKSLDGIQIFGIGGAPPAPVPLPYVWTDEELSDLVVPDCDVVLSHTPPARTKLDVMRDGRHIGSEVIRRVAEDLEGVLVCGHVHEAPGLELVGRSLCYNVGSLGPPDGGIQAGTLTFEPDRGLWRVRHVDLESGRTRTEEITVPV